MLPAFSWFIPSAVWDEKPRLSRGRWYAEEVLGWPPDEKSEAAMTMWGDGYMNFGLVGVLLFVMIWQSAFYIMYQRYLRVGGFTSYLVVMLYLPMLFAVETNLAVVIPKVQATCIIVLFFYILSRLSVRSSSV